MTGDYDYSEELYLDRKRKEGWIQCTECKQWLHQEDYKEGSAYCECSQSLPEEEEEE